MTEINLLVKECIEKTISEKITASKEEILKDCVGVTY